MAPYFQSSARPCRQPFVIEIGIVHLDVAVQGVPGIPLSHRKHQFLLDQTGGKGLPSNCRLKDWADKLVLAGLIK